ncbi:MAG: hypothetical protein KBF58_03465 [Methyloversatilis sp.]|jgi:hypothetical protein|nr:hypothetical protein [Methyloversatilis sp.]MBP6193475.1 hypothetical protein [Methyloversatilis sp.]MBP9117118.1 hypothetical protein [Methyloversatilis sp.]
MNGSEKIPMLVPRTCTTRPAKNQPPVSLPLADYREVPAYVLLGDPGAGKTQSFRQEAAETGGHYIRARDFATFDPDPELAGKVFYIDGLDEMRAGSNDGRTPLDHVRRHLARLGKPRFRLSCREADWLGSSDREALKTVAPGGAIAVLHLDPLSADDIRLLLNRKFSVAHPDGFIRDAERHGLDSLLRNPQTLELMVEAVGGSERPDSRADVYDLACRKLVREPNGEHQAATRAISPPHDALLEAAGFLGAVQLLGGLAGFALEENAEDSQHALWRKLSAPGDLPILSAMCRRLFQRSDDELQRAFVHRSIAEYLGARYLATRIESGGLPLGRVIALLVGEDGGVVPELRGLMAWIATHCRSARETLIERDPLGVVLYGDVRTFPVEDKRRILAALRSEAERYKNFRSEDWTASPFGALSTPDMVPTFLELLASPARTEADVALLDCVLDALLYGPPLSTLASADDQQRLTSLLEAIARNAGDRSDIRATALDILMCDVVANKDRLIAFAKDAHSGRVKDEDDELIGRVLPKLFPDYLSPKSVFELLHPRRRERLIGAYRTFWSFHVAEQSPDALLPEILDQMAAHHDQVRKVLTDRESERIAGKLIARALEVHGDWIDDARLYDWLGTGLDEHGAGRVEPYSQQCIAQWFKKRPERYKAILTRANKACVDSTNLLSCLRRADWRLYGSEVPSDIVPWLLQYAEAADSSEVRKHYFSEAVRHLTAQGGQRWPTLEALEFLEPWVAKHSEFEVVLQEFTSWQLDDWRKQQAIWERESAEKRTSRQSAKSTWLRKEINHIRAGTAHPSLLNQLAAAYLDLYSDISGETPRARLRDLFGPDDELIGAAYLGFRRSLDRNDLPAVAEIVDLETKGRMHFIRQPCLVGMTELFASDPAAAIHLDDEVLRKLVAFRLTWGAELAGDWLDALIEAKAALVADVLVTYALAMLRAGRDHLYGIWRLGYGADDMAGLARLAVPRILEGFPLRANEKLLSSVLDPLLKAGLRHLDRPAMTDLVSARLARSSMTTAQRTYWLACGLMMSPDEYSPQLKQHVGRREALLGHLGNFLVEGERWAGLTRGLSLAAIGMLIETLAPNSPPERPEGAHWVSQAMQVADVVRGLINTLGNDPSDDAGRELERLLAQPGLTQWQDTLRHSIHAQRIARRKATYRRLDVAEVCRTLANREPANAADLAALTVAHLQDLARRIRDGSTNDYRQYWSNKRRKPENECRDALLSDLKDRLAKQGVDAIKEGYYAEDKRADIRVAMGGTNGFNVPIEIKKDIHKDLWRAIRGQLIERYTRDPGTDGFGIYLVFWFGGSGMPLNEGKKPRTAAELHEQLHASLTDEEARRISVVVIDCALPASKK